MTALTPKAKYTAPGGRPPVCPRCGRLHRHWRTLTECVLRPTEWVIGDGPFGSVADCPRGRTIILHLTTGEAEASIAFVNRVRCGGACRGLHRLVDLRGVAE